MIDLLKNGGAALLVAALYQKYSPGMRMSLDFIALRTWEIAFEVISPSQIEWLRKPANSLEFRQAIIDYVKGNLSLKLGGYEI